MLTSVRGHGDAWGVVRPSDALLILFDSFQQAQPANGIQRDLSRSLPYVNIGDQPGTN
jgi:hypothetical protein